MSQPTRHPGSHSPPGRNGRRPIRVLIADDNPDIRRLLRLILTDAGITVSEAADGQEALRRISADAPDVVLLDWVMEDGGLELARELIEAHDMEDRVIMLTGLFDPRDRRAALHVGIAHYFVKPPDTDALIAAIHTAAQGRSRGVNAAAGGAQGDQG
jgi:DNA-binding response OmpR family regulator